MMPTIQPLTRFWLGLERIPGFAAVEREWRAIIGDDFDRVRELLLPHAELAQSVPHPTRPGCWYDVVRHDADDIVGVCSEDGDRITLNRHDLVVHRLSAPRFLAQLADHFSIPSAIELLTDVPHTWRVGWDRPTAGYEFPLFLVLATDRSEYLDRMRAVASSQDTPFRVVAPTDRWHRQSAREFLERSGASFFPLADSVEWTSSGWRRTQAAQNWWDAFYREHLPVLDATLIEFFPTPSGATWSQLQVRFLDGERLRVQVGGMHRVVNHTQMGFVDGRNANPTKSWELLRAFARVRGFLSWRSGDSSRSNQKQQEQLRKLLKAFFRIPGEPIVLAQDRKSWQCVFKIENDT